MESKDTKKPMTEQERKDNTETVARAAAISSCLYCKAIGAPCYMHRG